MASSPVLFTKYYPAPKTPSIHDFFGEAFADISCSECPFHWSHRMLRILTHKWSLRISALVSIYISSALK